MKNSLLSILLLSLGTSFAVAQPTVSIPRPTDADRPRLVIRKLVEPVMPRRTLVAGVTEGSCRIVISVDSEGKLADYLIVAYTHPALADAVVTALKRWEFEPPTWHGQPVSIQREMEINFQNRGVVLSESIPEFLDSYLGSIFPNRFSYHPTTMKELDRIPTPLHTEVPRVAKGVSGEAVIQFFIDEKGTVRMPSVLQADTPELADAAAAAVRTWQFEPPTSGGRPVLVRAQQTFRFKP